LPNLAKAKWGVMRNVFKKRTEETDWNKMVNQVNDDSAGNLHKI